MYANSSLCSVERHPDWFSSRQGTGKSSAGQPYLKYLPLFQVDKGQQQDGARPPDPSFAPPYHLFTVIDPSVDAPVETFITSGTDKLLGRVDRGHKLVAGPRLGGMCWQLARGGWELAVGDATMRIVSNLYSFVLNN